MQLCDKAGGMCVSEVKCVSEGASSRTGTLRNKNNHRQPHCINTGAQITSPETCGETFHGLFFLNILSRSDNIITKAANVSVSTCFHWAVFNVHTPFLCDLGKIKTWCFNFLLVQEIQSKILLYRNCQVLSSGICFVAFWRGIFVSTSHESSSLSSPLFLFVSVFVSDHVQFVLDVIQKMKGEKGERSE